MTAPDGTAFAQAWTAFQRDNRKLFDGAAIHLPLSQAEYLKNRLWAAFAAGWNAREGRREH